MKVPILFVFCLLICGAYSRLPPKNQETEQAAPTVVENSPPKESPPVVNPVDNPTAINDQSAGSIDTNARKPMVILFRQRPSFSLFSDRSSNPFAPLRPSLLDSPFHNLHHGSSLHDDPAIRLISLLMGNHPRIRPMQPESSDESNESTSAESSAEETNVRDVNPFERLFPNIFPRFPIDDHDHDKEPSSSGNDDKTPVNFENKEKKVVNIDGRKFVKTTQVKKVKNDFGQFHSVISSYQPFDENIHDENGNEKIKPSDSEDSKISSTVEKKDVQPSNPVNPVVEDEKVDIVPLTSSTTTSTTTTTTTSTTTSTSEPVEKEEVTSTESSVSDKSSSVTPDDDDDDDTTESKEPERLVSTSESSNKENEIPDKNAEVKVDQMN